MPVEDQKRRMSARLGFWNLKPFDAIRLAVLIPHQHAFALLKCP